ncbi:hypothetical protein Sjap_000432 [Stephania japonica]|uniref:Uncharacterized protein n=1 Tax=Stephania japonica TaxID=461633 RepID=A0AAP0KI17_9MAGN
MAGAVAVAAQGGGKSKKKSCVIDDDEYSIGTDLGNQEVELEVSEAATSRRRLSRIGRRMRKMRFLLLRLLSQDEQDEHIHATSNYESGCMKA